MIRLVTFGRGGDRLYDDDGSQTSGYGSPENPHAARGERIPDGTPAIDTRAATETPEGFAWVFKGPMCDPSLPDGEVDAVPEPSGWFAQALAEGSPEFGRNLALHVASRAKGERAGPLDHVSVAEFVRGWREHGARIGTYRGGAIVWE